MSDEVDYMSEEFISECVGNNDIRPGLSHSHSMKRKFEMEKKKKQRDEVHKKKMKPLKELQEERLKEGLATALDSSNKGFALMQKMGFKPGMSLGKSGGIVEPISVQVKSDRIGLGWQQLIEEKRKKIEQIRKARSQNKEEFDPLKYRERKSNEHNQKKIAFDLNKSRKVCYDLDSREGYTEPHEYWFWPTYTWEFDDEDEEEEDDKDSGADKAYIEDDHEHITGELLEQEHHHQDTSVNKISAEELDEIFEPAEQLQIVTSYLRTTYLYCIWCCTDYEDMADLETNCPGSTRADHDA